MLCVCKGRQGRRFWVTGSGSREGCVPGGGNSRCKGGCAQCSLAQGLQRWDPVCAAPQSLSPFCLFPIFVTLLASGFQGPFAFWLQGTWNFFDQGLNPCPMYQKQSLNHWIARKVQEALHECQCDYLLLWLFPYSEEVTGCASLGVRFAQRGISWEELWMVLLPECKSLHISFLWLLE